MDERTNRPRGVPPRLAERLLEAIVPPGVTGRSIIGDAREEYLEHLRSGARVRAQLRYWTSVFSIGRHFAKGPTLGRRPKTDRTKARGIQVSNLLLDLKLAIRLLFNKPGFTMAAVLTLGLGIGANTTIFSVVHAVLLKSLPYPEPEQLVSVFRIDPKVTGKKPNPARLANLYAVPYAVHLDWARRSPVFETAGAYAPAGFTMTGGDRPERFIGARMDSGVFRSLGVQPFLGRALLPEDDQVGAPSLAILSYGLWQRHFGSDSSILGEQVVLNSEPHTIIGVMPQRFVFPDTNCELWASLDDAGKESPVREYGYLQVIARLREGVTLEQAQREMDGVARQIGEAQPEEKEHGIGLFPRKELMVVNSRAGLLLLIGAVGLVLLIACANIANLLLVRATERRRELGLRQALGAVRSRLVVQYFCESLVLSLTGGVVGYWIAFASLKPLVGAFPGGLPRAAEISVDYRLLLFAVGLSIVTGLITGSLPALRAIRLPIVDVLRDGGRGFAGGKHRSRTQAALVVSEIALAFVLLAGVALFIKSYLALTAVEPGFAADNVLTMTISLEERRGDSDEEFLAFITELHERLRALPGVQAVGGASQMPFMGGTSWPPTSLETSDGVIDDSIHSVTVTPEYFATMKIPLVAGRQLAKTDTQGTPPVAVVSEAMVRKYWSEENPIGRRIRVNVGDKPDWMTVVGVVGDVKYGLNRNPYPQFYVPYAQEPGGYQNVVLKTAMTPDVATPSIRALLRSIDPGVPTHIQRLEDRIDQSSAVAGKRFQILLLGCLSGLAALLAVIGIYGVLAYIVSQRSHEIGIRMALGAGKASVMRNVVGRGLLLAGIGLVVGLVITLAFSRLMESLLFEVSPTDPATLTGVALLVALAAAAASSFPAYRATKVDPSEALRQE